MKLSHLLLTSTTAALTYFVITNKNQIIEEARETKQLVDQMQHHLERIQEKLAVVAAYQEPIQDMIADLQYKSQVFQAESHARLGEMKKIKEK